MVDNTYIPKYFELYELLPPELYIGDLYTSEIARQRAFASYFDTKLLITIDKVRDIIGKPLICNTWFQDGNRRYCGFRTENCSVGARLSAHKEGKAADLICRDYSAEQMRQIIFEHKDLLPYPIRIEDKVSWLHIDTREFKGKDKIYLFNA